MSNLLISQTDHVPDATIASNITPVTSIDWLKDSYAARKTRWNDLSSFIRILVTFDEPKSVGYVAIPGSNLLPTALVRCRVYDGPNEVGSTVLYSSGLVPVSTLTSMTDKATAVLLFRLPSEVTAESFDITIEHGYDYVPPTEEEVENPPVVTEETVSDGIYRQDENGTLSLEIENGEFTDAGLDSLVSVSENGASNDAFVSKTQTTFYSNANAGPRAKFEFTASQNGAHDVWVRMRSASNKNSFYTIFDGSSAIHITPADYSVWTWHKARTVTLSAETKHIITLAARDELLEVDKMVLLPAGTAVPNGIGPEESGEGTTTVTTVTDGGTTTVYTAGSGDTVDLRAVMAGTMTTFDRNFAQNAPASFFTDPNNVYTRSGRAIQTQDQLPSRRLTLSLPQMGNNDRQRLHEHERVMAGRAFIVCAYPDADTWKRDQHTFLARYGTAIEYAHRAEVIHTGTMQLLET